VLEWLDERSAPDAPAATWGAAPDEVDISDWLAALAVTALPSDGGDGGDGGVATELTTTTTLTPTPTSIPTSTCTQPPPTADSPGGGGDGRGGGGVCGRKKRSIEFVLEHRSVRENAYLAAFARAPWLPLLLSDPRFDRLLSGSRKALAKEVTEAFAVKELVARHLRACRGVDGAGAAGTGEEGKGGEGNGGEGTRTEGAEDGGTGRDDGDGVLIFDLCSGRGITGTILALEWPRAHIHMVDLEKTGAVRLDHVAALPNLAYHYHDLYASDLAPRIEALVAHADGATAGGGGVAAAAERPRFWLGRISAGCCRRG
jgi:hypothetical protein